MKKKNQPKNPSTLHFVHLRIGRISPHPPTRSSIKIWRDVSPLSLSLDADDGDARQKETATHNCRCYCWRRERRVTSVQTHTQTRTRIYTFARDEARPRRSILGVAVPSRPMESDSPSADWCASKRETVVRLRFSRRRPFLSILCIYISVSLSLLRCCLLFS